VVQKRRVLMRKTCVVALILLFAMTGMSYAEQKVYRFGLSLQTLQNPWMLSLRDGAQAAAKEAGNVELFVVGAEHSTDLHTQIRQIEDFIQMKIDVLGLFAIERKGIIPTMDKVNAAGIPIITTGTDSEGGKKECYIGTDEVLTGQLAAQWLTRALLGTGKIAILEGAPGSLVNHLRCKGFKTEIAKAKGIQVASSLTAKWRRDLGLRVMDDIITAHPDLDAVMAMNDEMALGALEALRARGKLKQVKIVGINGAAEAIQQVYRGNMAADMVHYPERIGELFIHWALKIAQGEKPPEGLPKTPTDPPAPHIDSGVGLVDRALLQIKVGPSLKVIQNEVEYYLGNKPM
jgi:ribose transport system substrate-binding protein